MPQETKSAEKATRPTSKVKTSHHQILSIEVTGGFLDGFKVAFADGLNCIIGGRGTGKTTVLEFLRYALNAMPDPHDAPSQFKQLERLIQGNLADGRLKVVVQTKEGLTYTVEHTSGEDIEVYDENGEPTDFLLDGLFDIEVYSQNEIEEIANNPHFQLDLIDKFKKKDIADCQNKLRTLNRELSYNASEIIKLKGEVAELSEGQSEIKLIETKLKSFPPMKGPEGNILQKEVERKGIRDKEKRFLTQLTNFVANTLSSLDGTRGEFQSKTGTISRYLETEATGQNADIFAKIKASFSQRSSTASAGMGSAVQSLTQLKSDLLSLHSELEKSHRQQELQYLDALKKNESEKGRAQEQSQLQKRYNELLEKGKDLQEKKKVLQSRVNERKELLKRLSELRDQRWNLRNEIAETLNAELEPELRIKVEPCGDRSAYRDLLKTALKGAQRWYSSLADKIATNIPPSEFAALIQSGNMDALVERLEIDEEKAQWVIDHLKDTESVYELETASVEDNPIIQLKDGDYKDSTSLSIGQKCTTILPILLLGSANPLMVDQPEDNLDNNFIYNTVVARIKKTQNERQMIFVTHNPNIPVLGSATKVFVMESNGAKASLRDEGTVDEVREDIETFLEGGREAFAKRKEIYGIR